MIRINSIGGALTRKNGEIQRIQMMSENPAKIYKVFKAKRKITFVSNADTINIEGIGNVGTTVNLWEDEYVVTFTKTDHRTEMRRIIVGEEDLTVTVTLIRTHGQLNIQSSPSGANVYINNASMGVTPLTLNSFAFGSYVVSLTKSEYYTDTFNVSFDTHPQNVSRTLNPVPAPPITPPEPPVIPDVPDPVNPPQCTNPGTDIRILTKTSAIVYCYTGPSHAPADRFNIYLDELFLTTIVGTSGSYILAPLVPGRTHYCRVEVYCKNGEYGGYKGTQIVMPK